MSELASDTTGGRPRHTRSHSSPSGTCCCSVRALCRSPTYQHAAGQMQTQAPSSPQHGQAFST